MSIPTIQQMNTIKDTGKVVAKYVSNTSITRLAKDSIFQFPVIISSAIDNDEIFVMAKALERNYASMMVSVISMSSYVDLNKYGKSDFMVKFLRRFHSNSNIGANIEANEAASFTIESANILPEENIVNVNTASLWDSVYESCDMSKLNDSYQPYTRTHQTLSAALEFKTVKTVKVGDTTVNNVDTVAKLADKNVLDESKDNNGNRVLKVIRRGSDKTNQIVKSDYVTDMSPTMLNITVVADATGKGDTWTQSVVLGIKSIVRMVKSGIMVNNMIDAFTDRFLFRWVKWTNGEISTAELIFGLGKALNDGYKSSKGDSWLKTLRGRKHAQSINKVLGKNLLPNASIIITESEAITIAEQCGIDPHNPTDVMTMMNRYFLLAFGIYNTESKLLDIIYDGEYQYSTLSIREMAARNKKETSLLTNTRY